MAKLKYSILIFFPKCNVCIYLVSWQFRNKKSVDHFAGTLCDTDRFCLFPLQSLSCLARFLALPAVLILSDYLSAFFVMSSDPPCCSNQVFSPEPSSLFTMDNKQHPWITTSNTLLYSRIITAIYMFPYRYHMYSLNYAGIQLPYPQICLSQGVTINCPCPSPFTPNPEQSFVSSLFFTLIPLFLLISMRNSFIFSDEMTCQV